MISLLPSIVRAMRSRMYFRHLAFRSCQQIHSREPHRAEDSGGGFFSKYTVFFFTLLALVAVSHAQVPQHAHIVIVVEENHAYSSVVGTTAMPYLNSLAGKYGLSTNY